MDLYLKPGMRLKTESGHDVEILKTDLNVGVSENVYPVLAVITRAHNGYQRVARYSKNGRCETNHAEPPLRDDLFNPLKNLKDGDPVFVRDESGHGWKRRHFAEFKNGHVFCYPDAESKWTYLGKTGMVAWKQVRVPTEAELLTGQPE